MRKALGSSLVLLMAVYSCGGGGLGDAQQGFYSLSLSLSPSFLTSPAVERQADGTYAIAPDTLSGTLLLSYSGTSETPLRGAVRRAELCLDGKCYPLAVGGILQAGQEVAFEVSISSHKFGVPWIVINPVEDEAVSTQVLQTNLVGGVSTQNLSLSYDGSPVSQILDPPVVENSLSLESQNATFSNSVLQTGVQAGVEFSVVLPRGSNPSNAIDAGSIRIQVGGVVCVDDGAGNITDPDGTNTNCSGTIDYATGQLRATIQADGDATITYTFTGTLLCYDDGNGNVAGDCTGTIDYAAGQLSFDLSYSPTSLPLSLSLSYSTVSGTSDGLTFYFTLPPDSYDSATYTRKVYGRLAYVYYSDGTLACGLDAPGDCTLTKDGNLLVATFQTTPAQELYATYTEDLIYDFNPAVDARAYNHLWNGSTTALVNGSIRIEVELEDGTTLSVERTLTFEVVPGG